ncbi:glycerate dehydrogenase [Nitrococcus mobilis Nb-231]|uniref:Glycerate dehydrogenase n=2 Tax=Nitrococcus mobilis TaxID=35797 RepID=A4BPX8_9GAMM|nr:glycerate dehydrogenase [Nitrococcus mobilis Nb-231]
MATIPRNATYEGDTVRALRGRLRVGPEGDDMQAVLLDRASLDLDDLNFNKLDSIFKKIHYFKATAATQTVARIGTAECAIVNKAVLDRSVLERCPRLRLICVLATGTNNVDLQAAAARGITVVNCRGYGTASLVQHVFMLVLALSRNLLSYVRDVRDGRWARADQFCLLTHPIGELEDRVLGIIGYGEIGRRVAQTAELLGMSVRVAQRPGVERPEPGRVRLPELLAEVDVLSLHCPLTPATRGLIGAPELARMKDTALLINTARGGIVDEAALADALRTGQIAGAGVDVLTEEPPWQGNPLLEPDISNLIVTPHCAWGSRQARQRLIDQTAENVRSWLAGKPLRVVAGPGGAKRT